MCVLVKLWDGMMNKCKETKCFASGDNENLMRSAIYPIIPQYPHRIVVLFVSAVLFLYKAAAGFRDERHLFGSLQRVTEL